MRAVISRERTSCAFPGSGPVLSADRVMAAPSSVTPEKVSPPMRCSRASSCTSVSAKGMERVGSTVREKRNSVARMPSAISGSRILSNATSRE